MDFFCNVFLFILEFRLVIVSPPRSVFLVCIRSEKEKEGKLPAKKKEWKLLAKSMFGISPLRSGGARFKALHQNILQLLPLPERCERSGGHPNRF
jgi:hypothetical protein